MGYERKGKKSRKRENRRRNKYIGAASHESVNYSSEPPKLPVDVVTAVLAWLPVSTLQNFRCVCRSWDLLVREDRCLASQHLNYLRRRDPENPGLVSLSISRRWSEPDLDLVEVYTLNYCSGGNRTVHKFGQIGGSYTMTNSCDGLVGVYGIDSFYVVNPSLRKIRGLPRGSSHVGVRSEIPQAGLGLDALTGEYKVVRLFHRRVDGRRRVCTGCEVLSLGGSKSLSWRLVDDPPPGEGDNLSLPVVVNGVIHWTSNSGYVTGLIALSFDLGREKFDLLTHPEGCSRPWPSVSSVTELGGCLCVADTVTYPETSIHMNVWLLKDYNNSKWVKQYTIDLTKLYKPLENFALLVKPLTIDRGRIVLWSGQGRRDYYDPQTRRFGKHVQIGNVYAEYVSPYDESMVWPWSCFCSLLLLILEERLIAAASKVSNSS